MLLLTSAILLGLLASGIGVTTWLTRLRTSHDVRDDDGELWDWRNDDPSESIAGERAHTGHTGHTGHVEYKG